MEISKQHLRHLSRKNNIPQYDILAAVDHLSNRKTKQECIRCIYDKAHTRGKITLKDAEGRLSRASEIADKALVNIYRGQRRRNEAVVDDPLTRTLADRRIFHLEGLKSQAADLVINSIRRCLTSYSREEEAIVVFGSTNDVTLYKEYGWINEYRSIVRARYTYSTCMSPREIFRLADEHLLHPGGLLTLSADEISKEGLPTCPGVDRIYKAVWARQGRGEPVVENGYIITSLDRDPYHTKAQTPGRALAAFQASDPYGLARRRRAAEERRDKAMLRIKNLVEGGDLPDHVRSLPISVSISVDAGNCDPGTKGFRDRYLPGKDSATIGDLADAISEEHGSLSSWSESAPVYVLRGVAAAVLLSARRNHVSI